MGQAPSSPILPELSFTEERTEIHRNEGWERWGLWDTPQRSTSGSVCCDTGVSHSYTLSHPSASAREGPAGPVLMPVLTVASGTASSKSRRLETQ